MNEARNGSDEESTEGTVKEEEKSDSTKDPVVAIVATTVYTHSAVNQLTLAMNRLIEMKNNPKLNYLEYQRVVDDVRRYLQIVQRNLHIITNAAKALCEDIDVPHLYREITSYIRQKRLPMESFLPFSGILPGEPEIQEIPLLDLRPTVNSNGDVFVSRRTRKVFRPLNDSGKVLVSEMVAALKGKKDSEK